MLNPMILKIEGGWGRVPENKAKVVPTSGAARERAKDYFKAEIHKEENSPHFQRHQIAVGHSPGLVIHRYGAVIPLAGEGVGSDEQH
jgi:hypothetical protein